MSNLILDFNPTKLGNLINNSDVIDITDDELFDYESELIKTVASIVKNDTNEENIVNCMVNIFLLKLSNAIVEKNLKEIYLLYEAWGEDLSLTNSKIGFLYMLIKNKKKELNYSMFKSY